MVAKGFPDSDLAAVGDDIQDLEMFSHAAVICAISVPNAHPVVGQRADLVTQRSGGDGIVVEICERILRAQDKWPY